MMYFQCRASAGFPSGWRYMILSPGIRGSPDCLASAAKVTAPEAEVAASGCDAAGLDPPAVAMAMSDPRKRPVRTMLRLTGLGFIVVLGATCRGRRPCSRERP